MRNADLIVPLVAGRPDADSTDRVRPVRRTSETLGLKINETNGMYTLCLKVTATVLKHVEKTLATGDLKPGNRLPTERDLAAVTGVGRAAVRAALQDLEFRCIVLHHVGRGTLSPRTRPPSPTALPTCPAPPRS
ncbi:GntR family transcriptional regulator [Streptomyces griseoincarnatus]